MSKIQTICEQRTDNMAIYIIKYCILFVCEYIYKFLLYFHPVMKKRDYYCSACSCFKNEAPYLKEWIEYHLLIGFDHFYLYNNNSTDDYRTVLQPYIEKGIVTLIEYPQVPCQPGIYEHWYKTYRKETNWVSFMDIDEFYCPLHDVNIVSWLKSREEYPVLQVCWKMFGTSGLMDEPKGLVTENYIVCWKDFYSVGKLFYNTEYEISEFTKIMHHSLFVKHLGVRIPPINQWGHFVRWSIYRTSSRKPSIQINHYWSKAYSCFELKHKRGSSAYGTSWRSFDKFLWHENHNISSDYAIYRFLIQLKLKML